MPTGRRTWFLNAHRATHMDTSTISSSITRSALRLVASVIELWGGVTKVYALTYIPYLGLARV